MTYNGLESSPKRTSVSKKRKRRRPTASLDYEDDAASEPAYSEELSTGGGASLPPVHWPARSARGGTGGGTPCASGCEGLEMISPSHEAQHETLSPQRCAAWHCALSGGPRHHPSGPRLGLGCNRAAHKQTSCARLLRRPCCHAILGRQLSDVLFGLDGSRDCWQAPTGTHKVIFAQLH